MRRGEPAFFQRDRPAEIPELDVTVEDTATQPESVVGEIYVVFRDFRQSGKSDKRRDRPRRYLYQKDLRGILAQFPVQLFRLLRRGERRGYLENFDSVAASGQIALDARHRLGTVLKDVKKLDLQRPQCPDVLLGESPVFSAERIVHGVSGGLSRLGRLFDEKRPADRADHVVRFGIAIYPVEQIGDPG